MAEQPQPHDRISPSDRPANFYRGLAIAAFCLSGLTILITACLATFMVVAISNQSHTIQVMNPSPNPSPEDSPAPAEPSDYEHFDAEVDAGVDVPPVNWNDPLLAQRIIVVSTNLNAAATRDVIEKMIYLNGISSREPINLYMMTTWGFKANAFAILDMMHLIRAPVNVWAIGACEHAGAMVLVGATGRRYATPNTLIMIEPDNEGDQSSNDGRFDAIESKLVEKLWRQHSHLPKDWYPLTKDGERYFSSDVALKFKVIDEIRSPYHLNALRR